MRYVYYGQTKTHIGMVNQCCRRCHGSGRLGFWNGKPIPCNCIRLIRKTFWFRVKEVFFKMLRYLKPAPRRQLCKQ